MLRLIDDTKGVTVSLQLLLTKTKQLTKKIKLSQAAVVGKEIAQKAVRKLALNQ